MSNKVAWYSTPGLARLCLVFSSYYILFATLTVDSQRTYSLGFFAYYYYAIVLVLAVLSLKVFREIHFSASVSMPTFYTLLGTVTLSGIAWWIYRKPEILNFPVWFDETAQFLGWDSFTDIVEFAGQQQQPPIDYYLSRFANYFFGINEGSVIFHAVLFSTLSLVLFAFLLLQMGWPLWLIPFPITFFSSYFILLQASSEGRPVSLAVFFSVLWFIFALECLQAQKLQRRALFITSLFLLNSIGLQPLFFLFLMSASLYWPMHHQLGGRQSFWFLMAACIVPFILFIPSLFFIHYLSVQADQFSNESYLNLWLKAPSLWTIKTFEIYIQAWRPYAWLLWLAPLGLLLNTYLVKNSSQDRVLNKRWVIATVIYLFGFPVLLQIFWQAVNYPLFERYFALWPVGSIILISICISQSLKDLKPPLTSKPALLFLVLSATAAVGLHSQFFPIQKDKLHQMRGGNLDWRKIMHLVEPGKKTLIIEMPYAEFGNIGWHSLTAPLYKNKDSKVVLLNRRHENIRDARVTRVRESLLEANYSADRMLLVFYKNYRLNEEEAKALQEFLKDDQTSVHNFQSTYFAVKRNRGHDSITFLRDLFARIVSFRPNSPLNYYMLEYLYHDAKVEKDKEAMEKWKAMIFQLPLVTPPMKELFN